MVGYQALSEAKDEVCSLSCLVVDLTLEQSENIAIAHFYRDIKYTCIKHRI